MKPWKAIVLTGALLLAGCQTVGPAVPDRSELAAPDRQPRTSPAVRMDRDARRLHMAAYNGDVHIIEMAFVDGVDMNVRDWAGRTPLHRAADAGDKKAAVAAAHMLLHFGADPNAKDEAGHTPLDYAGWAEAPLMWFLLLMNGAGEDEMDADAMATLEASEAWKKFSQFAIDRARRESEEKAPAGADRADPNRR